MGEIRRLDTCSRTPEGSIGCRENDLCVLTSAGVRRCVARGCRPDDPGGIVCGACLPDPEDPGENICWPGGPLEFGDPCSSSYDCPRGAACNAAGVCAYACTTEGEPCGGGLVDHVCRDHVCSPAAP